MLRSTGALRSITLNECRESACCSVVISLYTVVESILVEKGDFFFVCEAFSWFLHIKDQVFQRFFFNLELKHWERFFMFSFCYGRA